LDQLKDHRFLVADYYDEHIVVMMTDFRYWTEHTKDLLDWCDRHGCTIEGLTINIPDRETLDWFVLTWS